MKKKILITSFFVILLLLSMSMVTNIQADAADNKLIKTSLFGGTVIWGVVKYGEDEDVKGSPIYATVDITNQESGTTKTVGAHLGLYIWFTAPIRCYYKVSANTIRHDYVSQSEPVYSGKLCVRVDLTLKKQ